MDSLCDFKIIYINNFNILHIFLSSKFSIKFIWYMLCLANIRHSLDTILKSHTKGESESGF
jgi:hypothetical protein